ncbi:MAG: nuclear transport factor 2 family protein [Bacteroidetes bacterium]|nr:nuclear transport factor 2 family protein [Bacteroidota bacterium]
MKNAIFIIIIILLNGCKEKTDMTKESELLLKYDIEFAKTSLLKGAAVAFNTYMSDDAMQMPQGGEPIKGRENIFKSMKQGDQNYTLEWEPQYAEVSSSGDMGWTWGNYKTTYRDEGQPTYGYGKYVNVWKKQENGDWKVIVDIGNKSPDRE